MLYSVAEKYSTAAVTMFYAISLDNMLWCTSHCMIHCESQFVTVENSKHTVYIYAADYPRLTLGHSVDLSNIKPWFPYCCKIKCTSIFK